MNIEDQLQRLLMRQEAMVAALGDMAGIQVQTRDLVTELMAWLQEPPSSDFSDTLKAILEQLQTQNDHMAKIGEALLALPANVARAVSTGEVA